jgi:hypothetical protein
MTSCSNKLNIYFTDNIIIEKEIEQINGCLGFCDFVKNNFFFNKKDSLYIANNYLFKRALSEYNDCISSLTKKQIVKIFGVPNEVENNENLYYFIKKYGNGEHKIQKAIVFRNQNSKYRISLNQRIGQIDNNYLEIVKNQNLFKAAFLSQPRKYKALDNANFQYHCYLRKENIDNEIFFHKEKKYWIVNTLLLHHIQADENDPYPCIKSFDISEIQGLFGKVSQIESDTISFNLYNEPFKNLKGEREKLNGTVPVLQFQKQESGLYKCSFEDQIWRE